MNKQGKQTQRWSHCLEARTGGNPAGRPIGARQKISEKLLADLAVVWEQQGGSCWSGLAVTDPGKLAQIAYGLLPRDVFIRWSSGRRATSILTSGRSCGG